MVILELKNGTWQEGVAHWVVNEQHTTGSEQWGFYLCKLRMKVRWSIYSNIIFAVNDVLWIREQLSNAIQWINTILSNYYYSRNSSTGYSMRRSVTKRLIFDVQLFCKFPENLTFLSIDDEHFGDASPDEIPSWRSSTVLHIANCPITGTSPFLPWTVFIEHPHDNEEQKEQSTKLIR